SEVRLLKEMEKVGENSSDNLIICGDSLNALTSLTKIPEYQKKYVNKVKLIYIDPPFNTGQMFANYDDQLEHSVWLTMMRDRVLKAYELLSDDVDLKGFKHKDEKGYYKLRSLRQGANASLRSDRPTMYYSLAAPNGEEIYPDKNGGYMPYRRQYAEKSGSFPSTKAKGEIKKLFPEIEPFSTPKPERLLKRIIQIATNEGDIVLDYFAGSGTTAAVAQKLKLPRLKKVASGEDKGGIMEKSMFDTHSGIICIAEHALNGKLAKLVATQLEYDYQPENEHFCGKKGDTLLAVVDGMLTEGLLNFLLNSLDGEKFLEIAALAVDPDLESKNYNNVKVGKVPNNILRHYARI
ncbi:19551_t:CDS:2, partial [Funneliformis geosporum]